MKNKVIDAKTVADFRKEFERKAVLYRSGKVDIMAFIEWFFPEGAIINESSRLCFSDRKYNGMKEFDINDLYEKILGFIKRAKGISREVLLRCELEAGRALISKNNTCDAELYFKNICGVIAYDDCDISEKTAKRLLYCVELYALLRNIKGPIATFAGSFNLWPEGFENIKLQASLLRARMELIKARSESILTYRGESDFLIFECIIMKNEMFYGMDFQMMPDLYFELAGLYLMSNICKEMEVKAEECFKKIEDMLIARFGEVSAILVNFYEGLKSVYLSSGLYKKSLEIVKKLVNCRSTLFGEFSEPVKYSLNDGLYHSMFANDMKSLDEFIAIKKNFRIRGYAFKGGKVFDRKIKRVARLFSEKYKESIEEYRKDLNEYVRRFNGREPVFVELSNVKESIE